jgi:hypothetical protein
MKDFEAFSIHFQRYGGFCLNIRGFCKIYEAFKRNFQRRGGFFKLI